MGGVLSSVLGALPDPLGVGGLLGISHPREQQQMQRPSHNMHQQPMGFFAAGMAHHRGDPSEQYAAPRPQQPMTGMGVGGGGVLPNNNRF